MTSPPLDSTDNRQRRAWYDITAIGQHTVGRRRAWHNITALGQHTWLDYVRRGMTSPPFYSTHGRTTSGVACHHRLWATHTIEQRLAGHAIIAHGRQKRSNDVRRYMPSPPLENTHGRTTSGMACHLAFGKHTRSKDVGRGMKSPPLGSTHGQTTLGVTCHHVLWTAHMVERRRAWHAIITLGQHKWSDGVGRGIPSAPLEGKPVE